MAKNLQSKLGPGDKVSIFDIDSKAMKGLETEMQAASGGAAVELAASAFDAAKDAVSSVLLDSGGLNDGRHCSIYDQTGLQPLQ